MLDLFACKNLDASIGALGPSSVNGGASKTIVEMSKSSIHRLPKFLVVSVVFRLTVILTCM